MNLRDLRYLIAVADKRHFGRAAEACHVSQPTLSGQIKKLEDYLGVTIFERTSRSVAVTPIGEEILRHARLAVEQADLIAAVAQSHRDPLAGPLRLGVIPTLGPYLMPLVLGALRVGFPDLRLVLSEETTDTLNGRLRRHELDAALLATAPEDTDFDAIRLFDEPFWLACPRDHALARAQEITYEDLASADMLLLADGHCLRDQAVEVCRRAGSGESVGMGDLRAASLETLLQLVGSGFGCTLVPALAMRGPWMTDMGVVARPLTLPGASRRVSLVFRRSFPRRDALESLADLVVRNLPNTVKPLRRINPPAAVRTSSGLLMRPGMPRAANL
jgi:LysR family hydrogen peroxide-inducible transcriptional activator